MVGRTVAAALVLVGSVLGFGVGGLSGAAQTASVAVVSIGDSNFNYVGETFWGTEWPTAIGGTVLFSRHIDADSGRAITRAGYRTSGLAGVRNGFRGVRLP